MRKGCLQATAGGHKTTRLITTCTHSTTLKCCATTEKRRLAQGERAAHAAWPGPLAKHTGSGLDCGKACSHLPKIVATLVCSRAVDRLRCLETVSQTTLPRNCLSRRPASETSGNCSLCQSKLSDLLAQQQTDNCQQNTTLNCSLYDRRQTTATLSPFENWSAAK